MSIASQAVEGASEPTWDVALLFPAQGFWSEDEYFSLPTNHLVEFSDGSLEVLPIPTPNHQRIVGSLYKTLSGFVDSQGLGETLFAPFPVRLRPGKYREPDIAFLRAGQEQRVHEDFWEGADLVMEVLSSGNREHDLSTKRRECAQAGVLEYWVIDPANKRILVLSLAGGEYRVHGEFRCGQEASSVLLPGFAVPVGRVLGVREP